MSCSYTFEDLVALQNSEQKTFKTIAEEAKAIVRIASEAESDLSLYALNSMLRDDSSGMSVVNYLTSKKSKIQEKERLIRDALWEKSGVSVVLNNSEIREAEYRRLILEEEIDGFCADRNVFIKTKILPRWRSDLYVPVSDRRPTYDTHAGKLMEKFTWELTEKYKIQRSEFVKKTLWFMFVYTSELAKKSVPDSDNHDTKNVQDALCQCFPGGDEPFNCQTFLSSFVKNSVPSGTYITLFPTFNAAKQADYIFENWEKYLSENKKNS